MEKYNTRNGTRHGTIREESVLFAKTYSYVFDWNTVKDAVLGVVAQYGYAMDVVLDERLLQRK